MKPYWSSEQHDLSIYLGDCLEVMPALGREFQCFVTDPFYGVDGGKQHHPPPVKVQYNDAAWSDTPDEVRRVAVPTIIQCIDRTERGAVTPGQRCMFDYPAPQGVGGFWSPAGVGMGPWGFSVVHHILYYGKDWRRGIGIWPTGCRMDGRGTYPGHPCPKPLPAWSWLVEKIAKPTDTVLDPFLGSGTTLVACYRLGPAGVGIELEEKYCELAARRLEQEIAQGRLFEPAEVAGPTQMAMI